MLDTAKLKYEFETRGYCVVEGLFNSAEVDEIRDYFERVHDKGLPGHYEPKGRLGEVEDALDAYPRVMQPHRFSDLAKRYMTSPDIRDLLTALFGEEPLGVQSMYYFKPPGARGQKMHQDQFYLQVKPGTCIAAWVAIDPADRDNGAMIVVPKTQNHPIDCSKVGFPGSYDPNGKPIPIPDGYRGESPELGPGDALFFNGSLIHGSGSNRSRDRFRRSFICHYVGKSCTSISESYHPLVQMDGRDVEREKTTDGGPCGTTVRVAH